MKNIVGVASVTKKITLALLGLFLISFLLVHMGINLCMLRSDGGEWFRAAAHFMGTNYIVKVMEVGLFAILFFHMALGIFIQIENWRARPVGYKIRTRSKTSSGSKLMIYTGVMIALFLVLHFMNFLFVKYDWVEGKYSVNLQEVIETLPPQEIQERENKIADIFQNQDPETNMVKPFHEEANGLSKQQISNAFGPDFTAYEPDFYSIARDLFKNPVYSILYILLFLALGLHLVHAFGSAFQTLGLAHKKYTPVINGLAWVYTLVIVIGFSIIPIFFLLT